jgi:organic radical activating enzyme
MNTFIPDLIIEITGACNRACVGCYAPNVVTKDGATELYEKRPELFLGIADLNNALNELENIPSITSIRGGEPSLHPKLPIILLMASRHSDQVMIETHGRWLLPGNVSAHKELVQSIKDNKAIVKISFDKMHGMKKNDLQMITDFLNWNEIDYRIAITESTLVEYIATRTICSWIDDDKIIFQQKATSGFELVRPMIGTINVAGELNKTLTHKFIEESTLGVAFA